MAHLLFSKLRISEYYALYYFNSKLIGYINHSVTFATIINYFIYLMKTGTVKFFNDSKGYGFIKDNDSENEYFTHVSGLVDEISENDEVTFELTEGKKGLNAVNVKKV
jgi:CspA family cold shock protein